MLEHDCIVKKVTKICFCCCEASSVGPTIIVVSCLWKIWLLFILFPVRKVLLKFFVYIYKQLCMNFLLLWTTLDNTYIRPFLPVLSSLTARTRRYIFISCILFQFSFCFPVARIICEMICTIVDNWRQRFWLI